MLDQRNSKVHQLNPVAGLVWGLCDGGHAEAAMVERVMECYDVGREKAESDVRSLLEHFLSIGLLVTDNPSAVSSPRDSVG